MAMTKAEVLIEAMSLSADDREALSDELRISLQDADRQQRDAAWLDEVRRRDAEFKAGRMTASPVDEVVTRLLARGRQ